MPWLIEAYYLNETREANKTPEHDHPESWKMINKNDFEGKKNMENLKKNIDNLENNNRAKRVVSANAGSINGMKKVVNAMDRSGGPESAADPNKVRGLDTILRHDRKIANENGWLIESFYGDEYLDEGKHCPDHPDSLGMKNKDDWNKNKIEKKRNFFERQDDEDERAQDRTINKIAANHKILKSDYEKYKNKELDSGAQERVREALKKEEQKMVKFADKHGIPKEDNYPAVSSAKYAAERYNKRHPESKVSMECTDILEIFQ